MKPVKNKLFLIIYRIFNYEKKNNNILRSQWEYLIDFFQSSILWSLCNSYQNIAFSIKHIGKKDNYHNYKICISLDDSKIEDTIYWNNNCYISYIIPSILNMINKIPSNSQVIDGFSIIETPYLANKRKFRATTKTDIIRRYEKNDLFGGLKMPKVNCIINY